MAYLNGRIPLSALTPIGGGLYLESRAAAAFLAAKIAVKQETGIDLVVIEDGAYRDIAGQERQKADAIADGDPLRAATPGFSTHGAGISFDVNNIWQYNLAQLEAILVRYGFRRNIPRESWHFTHDGSALAALDLTKTTLELEHDDMIRIQSPGRGIALVSLGHFRQLRNNEEVEQSAALMTKHLTGNDRQFELWRSMALDGVSVDSDDLEELDDDIVALGKVEAPPMTGAQIAELAAAIHLERLTDADLDAIAQRVAEVQGARLAAPTAD